MNAHDLLKLVDRDTLEHFFRSLRVSQANSEEIIQLILSSHVPWTVEDFIKGNNVILTNVITIMLNESSRLRSILCNIDIFDIDSAPCPELGCGITHGITENNSLIILKNAICRHDLTLFKKICEYSHAKTIAESLRRASLAYGPKILACSLRIIGNINLEKKLEVAKIMFNEGHDIDVINSWTNHLGIFNIHGPEFCYDIYKGTSKQSHKDHIIKYCINEFETDTINKKINDSLESLKFLYKIRDTNN